MDIQTWHDWKSNEEDLLVSLRHGKKDDFKWKKNHTMLWKDFADVINRQLHVAITSTQAMNKYASMKRKWKEVIDSGTGTETKYFRQKSEFDLEYRTKAIQALNRNL